MKILRVLWRDHFTLNGWQDTAVIPLIKEGELCETVGYLVKQNRKVLVVVASISEGAIADATVILKSCVEKVEVLAEVEDE